MEIDLQTRIAALLEAYPELEKTLLELSPAFARLQNPVLRRTVAKVTTIQQAARIAGIPPVDMVQTLRRAAGLAAGKDVAGVVAGVGENGVGSAEEKTAPPTWFDRGKITVRFDASPIIDSGQSPMQEIVRLSSLLKKGEIMELTTPFIPAPIIDLLRSKGFDAWVDKDKTYFTPR